MSKAEKIAERLAGKLVSICRVTAHPASCWRIVLSLGDPCILDHHYATEQDAMWVAAQMREAVAAVLLDGGLREAVEALDIYANGGRAAVLQAGRDGKATIALARLSGDTSKSVAVDGALTPLLGEKP